MKETQVAKGFSKSLHDKLYEEVIINAGKINFTRQQMIDELGCGNYIAASRLSKALKRHDITTALKLYQTSPFDLAVIHGIGETSLYVATCILDSHQYDVAKWWGWDKIGKFSAAKAKKITKAKKRERIKRAS